MAPIHAQTYVGPLPRWIFNISLPLVSLPSNRTFMGNFRMLWDVRTWLEKYLIHIDELYQSKTSKSKSYIFRFRVNHISHTHSRPKSSIYYRRLSWNSACDSFGAWILKKVEIIIWDTGREVGSQQAAVDGCTRFNNPLQPWKFSASSSWNNFLECFTFSSVPLGSRYFNRP